jgi:peptide/nickel transport system permease protein
MRKAAIAILLAVMLSALLAPAIAPSSYDEQFRQSPNAAPDRHFLMGTDDLGRDRFSRLLYGTRVSILLAPAAALVSVVLALLLSIPGASRFPLAAPAVSGLTTICLSLPWLFLFILLRAKLPLNTAPSTSVMLTFGLMGVAGWAWPARVFTASIRQIRQSDWILHARASGLRTWRIVLVHGWPHLRSLALAQFRVLVPVYILSEASLGLLGLGVADPLPSWGNLIQDLQHPDVVRANPWVLAPLALLILVTMCLESLQSVRETSW